jgi:Survival motor neuron (SMN) interacting protein 1 (SIP1)
LIKQKALVLGVRLNVDVECLHTMPTRLRAMCRQEAAQLPKVVTSTIDPRTFDDRRTHYHGAAREHAELPNYVRPDKQWLRVFLSEFASVREQLERWVVAWCVSGSRRDRTVWE